MPWPGRALLVRSGGLLPPTSRPSLHRTFVRMEGGGVGPRCSFCGTATGPFSEVGGGFPLQMCQACQAARAASGTAGLLEGPAELLAHHRPGEPHLQWGCPLCGYWAGLPWFLEGHTDAEHPGGRRPTSWCGRCRARSCGWCTAARPVRARARGRRQPEPPGLHGSCEPRRRLRRRECCKRHRCVPGCGFVRAPDEGEPP
jgi:hypothetical protein